MIAYWLLRAVSLVWPDMQCPTSTICACALCDDLIDTCDADDAYSYSILIVCGTGRVHDADCIVAIAVEAVRHSRWYRTNGAWSAFQDRST